MAFDPSRITRPGTAPLRAPAPSDGASAGGDPSMPVFGNDKDPPYRDTGATPAPPGTLPGFGMHDIPKPPPIPKDPAGFKDQPIDPPKDPPKTTITVDRNPDTTTTPGGVLLDSTGSVSYSSPPADTEKVIEVGGSGMGASQSYAMYPSEALEVYKEYKKHIDDQGVMAIGGKALPLEKLAADLKADYGMDAEVVKQGNQNVIIDKATGHVIAHDRNGDGALHLEDMDFKDALAKVGIDADKVDDLNGPAKAYAAVMKVVDEANKLADERRKKGDETFAADLEKGANAAKKVAGDLRAHASRETLVADAKPVAAALANVAKDIQSNPDDAPFAADVAKVAGVVADVIGGSTGTGSTPVGPGSSDVVPAGPGPTPTAGAG